MTIFVGRWDLLPKSWEGYNALIGKKRIEILTEISREAGLFLEQNGHEDNFIAVYSAADFEDTFNQTLTNHISSDVYWIRIFAE